MEWRVRLLLAVVLILASDATAQSLVWSKHYGGYFNEGGYACQPTADGGYVAIGSTYSFGSGDHDLYVIRLDSLGDTLWARTYGGSGTDYGRDIQITPDNGFLCVGSTTSSGAGKEDLYVVSIDQYGDLLWSKTIGGTQSDEGWSVRATSDSAYIICGTTNSSGAGYADLWLVKIAQDGAILWNKTFGGAGGESGSAVRETWDGYVAIGATGSFGEGYSSIYVVKTSFNGDSLWAKTYGGAKADFGYSLEIAVDNGLVLVGATASYGLGYYDAYVIKTTPTGDVEWERTFGGSRDDRAYAVASTIDGNYIVAGTTESFGSGGADIYLLKIDPLGSLLWSTTQGGTQPDYCRAIAINHDGEYVIAGYTYSYTTGGSDFYLATLNGDERTGIEDGPWAILPKSFLLHQNYPNPFNGSTTIEYELTRRNEVHLAVYNVVGQQVASWPVENQSAGTHHVVWDGRSASGEELATGIYFFRLEAGAYSETRKLVLLK